MLIKLPVWDGKKALVDVRVEECPKLNCYQLGQDKGTYSPGRGYTSYYKKPKWVCMTRHLHGCPETGEEEAKWQYLEQKKSGIGI